MDIDTILFDWGGTLARVTRQAESLRAGAKHAAEIIAGAIDESTIDSLIHRALNAEARAEKDPEHREVNIRNLFSTWIAEQGINATDAQLDAAIDAIGERWVGSLDPFPGTAEAVAELKQRGYRMGLVSNCIIPMAYCLKELERQGIGMLDFVVTSADVGYRKPSMRIYDKALKCAANNGNAADPSRILFVGDSPAYDVIKPAALGMKTALVTCKEGIWNQTDYDRAKPDICIDAVAELLEQLQKK